MSEVEKMYRNVLGYVCNMPDVDCFHECEKCDSHITFTAEKQIELIKWMIKTKHRYFMQDIIAHDFSKTLAGVFNFYWQSLTEEERNQIKEILE